MGTSDQHLLRNLNSGQEATVKWDMNPTISIYVISEITHVKGQAGWLSWIRIAWRRISITPQIFRDTLGRRERET